MAEGQGLSRTCCRSEHTAGRGPWGPNRRPCGPDLGELLTWMGSRDTDIFHAERSISALSACCAPGAGRSGRGRMSLADTPVCRDTGGHGLCGSGGGRPGEWGWTKDAGAQPRRPPRQRCPLCARHSVLWQWLLDSVLLSLAGPWDPLPPRRCWVGCQGQHGQLRQCPDPPGRSGIPALPALAGSARPSAGCHPAPRWLFPLV